MFVCISAWCSALISGILDLQGVILLSLGRPVNMQSTKTVTELCTAWKFDKLKMYVLLLLDLGYCQSLWFCFVVVGFFVLWVFFGGERGCGVGWFVCLF